MKRIRDRADDYFSKTSAHGFQFLTRDNLWIESIFWIICLAVSGYFVTNLIQETLDDAYNHPVLTTIETVPISNNPFPAVTIDSGKLR